MEPSDRFESSLTISPVYETEDRFFFPFWDFASRIQSLQRHWHFSKEFIDFHISQLDKAPDDGTAEWGVIYTEVAEVDIEFFPNYLRGSIIAMCFALFETLLGDVAEEAAKDTGNEITFEKKRPLPYINRYILWLSRSCGLDLQIDKQLWKELDAVRELRNKFIHRIDRDLPSQIRETLETLSDNLPSTEFSIGDDHVELTFSTMANLAKLIELAYLEFYDSREKTNRSG
ncbi:MAG: hypothetical protein P8M18_07650 [Woeseiaceae bacterium]|nr:hypothetical protein [Woeseiaceae bacterium]